MFGQPYTTHHLQFHHILFYHSSLNIPILYAFPYKHPLCFYFVISPFTHGYIVHFIPSEYMMCYIYVAMVTIQNLRVGGGKGWLTDGIYTHRAQRFPTNATILCVYNTECTNVLTILCMYKWPRFSKLKLYDDMPYIPFLLLYINAFVYSFFFI